MLLDAYDELIAVIDGLPGAYDALKFILWVNTFPIPSTKDDDSGEYWTRLEYVKPGYLPVRL